MNPEFLRSENTREGKEEYWREVEASLDDAGDNLGMKIDKGVRKAVVALNVIGLPTEMSCEGHSDRGYAHPWVQIEEPGMPERFEGENGYEMEERIAKKYGINVYELYDEAGKKCGARQEAIEEYQKKVETQEYKDWRKRNDELQALAEQLLQEFYVSRQVPEVLKLKFNKGPGAGRIQNGSNVFMEERGPHKTKFEKNATKFDKKERALAEQNLPALRAEMDAFADFIKEKYLSDENI